MPRSGLVVIVGFAVLVVLVVLLAQQAAPPELTPFEPRSIGKSGPGGSRALADALRLLGVDAEAWERPIFGFGDSAGTEGVVLALFDVPPMLPGEPEALVDWVARGGDVFLAGDVGLAEQERLGVAIRGREDVWREFPFDAVPDDVLPESRTHLVLTDTLEEGVRKDPRLVVQRIDTLSGYIEWEALALRIEYANGGRALFVADADWVSNAAFRRTAAGVRILEWLLALEPDRVVFDEYHHGLQETGLFSLVWRWLWGTPAGWITAQLIFAALVALAVASVRFGPIVPVVTRRRRSPVEHLEALAGGLERAGGHRAAIRLLTAGLCRRLGRRTHGQDPEPWLAALEHAGTSAASRETAARLRRLLREPGSAHDVEEAAQLVEDLWEALGQRKRHATS